MKVPFEWLNDYIKIDDSPEELAKKFLLSGLEVESISKTGIGKQDVVVSEIIEIKKHPNSDSLFVTLIDTSSFGKKQIITNFQNLKNGQKILVGLEGVKVKSGFEIKKTKIKEIESDGIIIKWEDLGFDYSVEVPIFVDNSIKNGTNYLELIKFEDSIIELELTANRGDCLGLLGVSREVSSYYKKNLEPITNNYTSINIKTSEKANVDIKSNNCHRYCAGVILDVNIQPSPLWLQARLIKAGIRPINNVVDITNYLMLECNQPLHAFDLDKIEKNTVIIRDGKENEILTTLDGVNRNILVNDIIISDSKIGHCIGGIMGGQISEVSETTKNIFLEAAFFDPSSVRKTSKRLGLRSESSYRFERTIDKENVSTYLKRALYLFDKLKVGKICDGIIDVYPSKDEKKIIKITCEWINNKLGSKITEEKILDILKRLGFVFYKEKEVLKIEVPSWRNDVSIKEDIAEEIARIFGYNNIKPTIFPSSNAASRTPYQQLEKDLREMLYQCGCDEAFNLSLVGPFIFDKMKLSKEHKFRNIVLMDIPLSDDLQGMRNSLIPGMIRTSALNYTHQNKSFSLFEIGNVSFVTNEELPKEELFCSVVLCGIKNKKDYTNIELKYDFFDIKGILDTIFTHFKINADYITSNETFLHPYQQGKIIINGIESGIIGKVHPSVCESLDIDSDLFLFEFSVKNIFDNFKEKTVYKEVPKFPSSERDLAIIVEDKISANEIINIVKKSNISILQDVKIFDIYKGDNIETGKHSIAFNMSFNKIFSTLTDKEVDEAVNKIFENLKVKFNAVIR